MPSVFSGGGPCGDGILFPGYFHDVPDRVLLLHCPAELDSQKASAHMLQWQSNVAETGGSVSSKHLLSIQGHKQRISARPPVSKLEDDLINNRWFGEMVFNPGSGNLAVVLP